MFLIRMGTVGAVASLMFAARSAAQPASMPAQPAIRPAASMPAFDENSWRKASTMRAGVYEPLFAEIYKMNDDQKAKLKTLMADVVEADVKYNKENHEARAKARDEQSKLLRDLMNARREKRDEAEIKRLEGELSKMQQKFFAIQKGSPFELDKIAERIEKDMPADQAKAGHAEFEKRKPYGLRQPPSTQPTIPQMPNQPAQPPGPMTPQVAQPTRFRTIAENSPPPEKWEESVNKIVAERKYDADQSGKAKLILANIKDRLKAYTTGKQAAIDAANKLTDAKEKEAKLKEIDREPHLLYDELMQRVDNVARADQMPGAASNPAPAPGAPGAAAPKPGAIAPAPATQPAGGAHQPEKQ